MINIVSILIAIVSSGLFGYHSGIMSSVLLAIEEPWAQHPVLSGSLVAALVLGAFLGTLLSPWITNLWGSRGGVVFTVWGFFVSNWMLYASTRFWPLFCGRLAAGICVGVTALVVPLFLAEISPAKNRGMVVTFAALATVTGIFIAYCMGALISDSYLPWSHAFLYVQLPILAQILALPWLVRTSFNPSPSWLRPFLLLFEPKIKGFLYKGIILNVLQQGVGINAIVYYAPLIFKLSGKTFIGSNEMLSMGTGCVAIVVTLLSALLIDKWGRRPLFLLGSGGMTLSLMLLVLCLVTTWSGLWLSLAVALFLASYSISLGPLPSVFIAEVYPSLNRSQCMAVCLLANWSTNYLLSFAFLPLVHSLGLFAPFLIYATIAIGGFFWGLKFLPETKGTQLSR
jgi:MFS family permease